jgi:hypothetical protein
LTTCRIDSLSWRGIFHDLAKPNPHLSQSENLSYKAGITHTVNLVKMGSRMTAVNFNYPFGDQLYPCTYEVRNDLMTVEAMGKTHIVAVRQTDDRLRLARVVAHDILSKPDRDGLL